MALLGRRVSQEDLRILKVICPVAPGWWKALWFVTGLLVWGWGGTAPAYAGCGDHLTLVLHREGEHPTRFPWIPNGGLPDKSQPHAPCPGPGCSPAGPTLPPLSLAPPVMPESSKSSAAADCRTISWHQDDPTTSIGWPSTQALRQGVFPDIFHPPRLEIRSC